MCRVCWRGVVWSLFREPLRVATVLTLPLAAQSCGIVLAVVSWRLSARGLGMGMGLGMGGPRHLLGPRGVPVHAHVHPLELHWRSRTERMRDEGAGALGKSALQVYWTRSVGEERGVSASRGAYARRVAARLTNTDSISSIACV